MHKVLRTILTSVFVLFIASICLSANVAYADDIEEEREYKPLDLVLVIDGSGSMAASDPERTAIAAGRMLTNMMPAEDSRVAIISFNTKATVHTGDGSGAGSLVGLDAFANVESVRDALAQVKYSGDTGIGNALFAAVELLEKESDDSRQGAIILFTDGTNDFGKDALGLARCEENEATALKHAKKSGYPVYCVGYDYALPGGGSSMGANGEGLAKLENISNTTEGEFQAISSIKEMEQLLVDFLADVCDLHYTTVATIPGDGELHEAPILVGPSVVELDIRIAGSSDNAISKGEIHLYDPAGEEITLTNSGNIRYDVDATAASIKVIRPQAGEWKLVVNGIYGDDIHVGMLEHFKMNLKSRLTFPKGNPAGVVYANDKVGIETWLTYDGADLEDSALYDSVTSATATFTSRADESDETVVELKRKGNAFVGEFTVPADSYYDILVRINWDTVYRESKLTVMSSNRPLALIGEIEDIKVNKNKTVTIDNIYQYVQDDENDPITAEVKSIGSPDVVDVSINGDTVAVTGRKWSSTLVTIQFRDKQGNTVESTFKTKVNDPVAIALIILGITLIVLAILATIYQIIRRTYRIFGNIRVGIIKEITYNEDGGVVTEDVVFEDRQRMNRGMFTPSPKPREDNGGWGDGDAAASARGGWGDGDAAASARGGWGDGDGGTAEAGVGWGDGGDAQDEQNTAAQVDVEELEDEKRDARFERGLLDISTSVKKRKPSLYDVLETFSDVYTQHMTMGNHDSLRAKRVSSCIVSSMRGFTDFKITGTPFGRGGISIHIPTRSVIRVKNPIVTKNHLSLGRSTVMQFEIQEKDSARVLYLEIEYDPVNSR